MNTAAILALAMLLDALLGEPRWLWRRVVHPTVLLGRIIGWLDAHLNTGPHFKIKGLATAALLVALTWILGLLITAIPGGALWQTLLAAALLAHRSLVQHVRAVASGLRGSLADGRAAVAHIVGRVTAQLQSGDVARAAIESAAENLSDGVIAPVFWFLILGLPGMLVYKIINTADSMIGYKTPRHAEFGWATARLDDALNLIPARLSALIIIIVLGRGDIWRIIRRDAPLHRSPNAGWPEAAMAAGIDVSLAGPRSYAGQKQDFARVNPEGRHDIDADDIDAAVAVLWRAWAFTLLLVLLATLV